MSSHDHLINSNDASLPRLRRALSSRSNVLSLKKSTANWQSTITITLNVAVAFLLPPILAVFGLFKWFDLFLRVGLAEFNRNSNEKKLAARNNTVGERNDAAETIASIVGYREGLDDYERALKSLAQSGAAIVIAGIDGNDEVDMGMVGVCNKVFDPSHTVSLNLPESIGKKFLRNRPDESLEPSFALHEACVYLESHLQQAGIVLTEKSSNLPRAICFTQPHCDLKEIRLTSWTLALVLNKRFGFKYLWSTDSDTLVLPDTIPHMSAVLASEPKAAGASAYVRLHNADDTVFSKMVSIVFALDTYLNRAAAGALSNSEYLHGPATIFRLSALREIVVPWCRFHYFFQDESKNSVLNEDIQYSMLLAQGGWKRLYVENASIMTGGPESLRRFLGQRLRWSRGIMLHRVLDAAYLAGEGPITVWYMLRTAFYDVFVFLWIAYYAITGHALFPVSKWDILVFEILPPIYNYLRCPAPLPSLLKVVSLYALYRITLPFIRAYTILTPLNTAWSLPSAAGKATQFKLIQFVRQEHEGLAFSIWGAVLAAAIARGAATYVSLENGAIWAAMYSSMAVGGSLAAYGMFAK